MRRARQLKDRPRVDRSTCPSGVRPELVLVAARVDLSESESERETVKHLLKVPTQKEASEGLSRRISGQPRPISAHLGQSRPISANPGQPRPTSAILGQPRPISASLGHPRPPLAHAPTTSAHAPNNHGPRANLLSVVDGGPIECPPAIASGNAPVESGVISDRSFDRTEPARHSRRPSLRPYATRAEGSEIDRGARRTRLLPHTNTTIPI